MFETIMYFSLSQGTELFILLVFIKIVFVFQLCTVNEIKFKNKELIIRILYKEK
jgi:hypothetical protein